MNVIGIPAVTYQLPHIERIELYRHDKLIGLSELTPLKDEEMESILKIEAEEASFAGIGASAVNNANISKGSVEKSVTTNLRALVSCNFHGVSEAIQEIEVLPEELKKRRS